MVRVRVRFRVRVKVRVKVRIRVKVRVRVRDMRVWKGRQFQNILKFEIMTSVDADLTSRRRFESGRRYESYHIYI
jgi:hypothetical protein